MFDTLFIFLITLSGLLIGSFLNVIIVRIPRTFFAEAVGPHSIVWPGSQCPTCQHKLSIQDNLPILSFMLLKGRCRYCHVSISSRYPIVELLACVVSLILTLRFGISFETLAGMVLCFSLIALAFIDLEHMILPDQITLPILWLGLLLNAFNLFHQTSQDAILGAVLGYLSLWSVYWIFKIITGKEGMGYGDFKLNALLGAWLGWQAIPFIILMASFLGALVGAYFIILKKMNKNTPLPFGPYLAFSGGMALFLKTHLLSFYDWFLT